MAKAQPWTWNRRKRQMMWLVEITLGLNWWFGWRVGTSEWNTHLSWWSSSLVSFWHLASWPSSGILVCHLRVSITFHGVTKDKSENIHKNHAVVMSTPDVDIIAISAFMAFRVGQLSGVKGSSLDSQANLLKHKYVIPHGSVMGYAVGSISWQFLFSLSTYLPSCCATNEVMHHCSATLHII